MDNPVWVPPHSCSIWGSLTRFLPLSCPVASGLSPAPHSGSTAPSHPLCSSLCSGKDGYKENHLGKFQAAVTKPVSTEGRLITQLINPTDVTLNACFFVILLHTSCWLNRLHGPSSKCLHRLLGAGRETPGCPVPQGGASPRQPGLGCSMHTLHMGEMPCNSSGELKTELAAVRIEGVVYILATSTGLKHRGPPPTTGLGVRERGPHPASSALRGMRKREFGNLSCSGEVSSSDPRRWRAQRAVCLSVCLW